MKKIEKSMQEAMEKASKELEHRRSIIESGNVTLDFALEELKTRVRVGGVYASFPVICVKRVCDALEKIQGAK